MKKRLKLFSIFDKKNLSLIEVDNSNAVELIWEKTTYDFIGLTISIIGLILLTILLI